MAIINERLSILEDEEIKISLPRIPGDQFQYLLIYEASKSLHTIGIKEKIVDFLIDKEAENITVYVNSSIYFTLNKTGDLEFKKLNKEFAEFILPLETTHNGKLFWVFNQLIHYKYKKEPDLRASAIIGKGNKSLKDQFEGEVQQLRTKKREPKTN